MIHHFGTLDECGKASGRRLGPSRDLAIYLRTPGFSFAYHKHALGISDTTVAKYNRWASQFAQADPTIVEEVCKNVASITPEDGMKMAQRRGPAHLPFWSRLAIAEFKYRLGSTADVAALFDCSRRTVQLVIKSGCLTYDQLSGERRLTRTQASPPGMWGPP